MDTVRCAGLHSAAGEAVRPHGLGRRTRFATETRGPLGVESNPMRYAILIASVAIQLCLGGIYAWSAFVPSLRADYGLTTAQTQFVFGAFFTVFTLTMVSAGKTLERRGPRGLLLVSGLLFLAGYGLAGLSGGSFPAILLGVSGLAGAATGMGYACPISTCVKWFPRHKGLVTGVAVAGFGAGAIVVASLAEPLIEQGFSVLRIFGGMGVIYGAVIFAAGLVLRFPSAPHPQRKHWQLPGGRAAADPFFWALASGLFAGTFGGLIVIGSLAPLGMAQGISPRAAAIGVGLFAVGNGVGRILWGRLTDMLGPRAVLPSLACLAAAIALLIPSTAHPALFVLACCFAGANFGACFVVYAALTAARYGAHHLGHVYPLVFLAYGVAGLTGPSFAGWLRDFTGGYAYSAGLAVAVLLLGMAASFALQRIAPEKAPGVTAE